MKVYSHAKGVDTVIIEGPIVMRTFQPSHACTIHIFNSEKPHVPYIYRTLPDHWFMA